MTSTLLVAVLSLSVGSSPIALFRGPPNADGTHHRYWNSVGVWGASSPLEDYFAEKSKADVEFFKAAPMKSYRVLFTTRDCGQDESLLQRSVLDRAATWGADAAFVGAATQTDTTTTETTEHRLFKWWNVAVHTETIVNSGFDWNSEAVHFAEAGSEPFTGIHCSTYSPYGVEERQGMGPQDVLRMAYVAGVDGPAAKSGLGTGDFILRMETGGKVAQGDCWTLASTIRQAAPKAKVMLSVWRPSLEGESLELNVHLARKIGMEIVLQPDKRLLVSPRPGSPAALAGVRPSDELVLIDGTPVHTPQEAVDLVRDGPVSVKAGLLRAGKPVEVSIQTEGTIGDVGLRNMPGSGVMVTYVGPSALVTGLAPGDIITDAIDYHRLLSDGTSGFPGQTDATLHVLRQGSARAVTLSLEAIDRTLYHRGLARAPTTQR